MEGLDHVKHLVKQNIWMAKLDLKDAYLTVPIHAADQHFLQFIWKDRIFQFTCLAFGLASAPWAFTKLLKPVVSFLREQGIKIVVYLDDFLILNECKVKLAQHVEMVKELLQSLGFVINLEKSMLVPDQLMEFLGLELDSRAMSKSLPESKRSSIVGLCKRLSKGDWASLRDLASLLGNFTWATHAVQFAQAHFRWIQNLYIFGLKDNGGLMQAKVRLSKKAKGDLDWWIVNLMSSPGRSLLCPSPSLVIFSDASLSGWGAVCNGVRTGGPWTTAEADVHINILELPAAFFALQCYADSSRDCSIVLKIENSTAVCYINKLGGGRKALSYLN